MEQNQNIKASPRDVFLHLASIVALYGSAISFLILFFQLINIWIPDTALYYFGGGAEGAARGAIAGLVVFFPMYIASMKMLAKTYIQDENRRKIHIRKWLLYFTLFITAFVMAGDLISLIYNFLEGDLTLKFILKIIGVFFVAITIFLYYRQELKDVQNSTQIYIRYVVFGVVIASIVAGVIAAGSPFQERMRKMDDRRVNDLMMIQNYIVEYWRNKGSLPENLSMLRDDLRGVIIPNDPETNSEYAYGIKGDEIFVLCAVFSRSSTSAEPNTAQLPRLYTNQTWDHGSGKHCFERTIDKDFFPKNINAIEAKPIQ